MAAGLVCRVCAPVPCEKLDSARGGGATGGAGVDVGVGCEQTTRRQIWMKREMKAAVESSFPSLAPSHAW